MVDYTEVLNVPEWAAGHHMSVILEVDEDTKSFTAIFGSWEHFPKKFHCILPGSAEAAPFGPKVHKETHFAARNVAVVPLSCIVSRIGSESVTVDEFDAMDEVAQYAELHSLKKRSRELPPLPVEAKPGLGSAR